MKLRDLIAAYQTDPDSAFRSARYQTRLDAAAALRRIDARWGEIELAALGARDFKRWHEEIRGERNLTSTAHHAMTVVRMVFSFGVMFEIDPQCARLKGILSEMEFEKPKARTEAMTVRQCEDVIACAHLAGLPSIALAQALQFELCLRQKDVVGEWVPVAEPGLSSVIRAGYKWLRGLRWDEISRDMIVVHPMSKSRAGKVLTFDLKCYPMVMAELQRIAARTGPVIICELTGRPWKSSHFRRKWREIAEAAGVPASIRNMDSRAGGTTETIEATGGNIEAARKQAGHSDSRTTQRYSRGDMKSNSNVAVLRAKYRQTEKK
jgi:hypothetical protein